MVADEPRPTWPRAWEDGSSYYGAHAKPAWDGGDMKSARRHVHHVALLLMVAWGVLVGLSTVSSPAGAVGVELRGADAMTSFDRLPHLRRGTTVHQVSSFDRSGGNNDGSKYRYRRNPRTGGYVVLEESRPGTIYRIWATGLAGGSIRMYFDHEETPRVDVPINDFFSGLESPFVFPLVGDSLSSSGGYYCYYPFSFAEAIRVEFTDVPKYYQMTYHLYNTADGVTPYSASQDMTEVYDVWSDPTVDPKDASGNQTIALGPFDLLPEEAMLLLNLSGPGSLRSFRLCLPQLAGSGDSAASLDILSHVRLRMRWDGEPSPSVDIPLGFFFGLGSSGEAAVQALLMGADPTTHTFWNFFPMPYSRSAEVWLANDSTTAIAGASAELQYNSDPYQGLGVDVGYFTAVYRSEMPTAAHRDYQLLYIPSGSGHVVGVVMNIRPDYVHEAVPVSVLEGDERVFIDAQEFDPQVHGTGTEDYFNAGWYFSGGSFTLPAHGCPVGGTQHEHPTAYAMYRLSLADAFVFESSIAFKMEHGGRNTVNADYESVVFAYLVGGDESLVQTDALNLGDPADRVAHGYETTGWLERLDGTFVGWDEARSFSGMGRAHAGTSTFTVSVSPENSGVRLARILNHRAGNQNARIYVDGMYAGIWLTGGCNGIHSALYDYFEVAPGLTRDKSSIDVAIEFDRVEANWTEFYYYAYSHVYPCVPTPTPSATHSPTNTATPTLTPSCTPTDTATPTAIATDTPTCTVTVTPIATRTSTASPTATQDPSRTSSPMPSTTATTFVCRMHLPLIAKK